MARQGSNDTTRRGLLQAHSYIPLRNSIEEADRSLSDEERDELIYKDDEPLKKLNGRVGGTTYPYAHEKGSRKAESARKWLRQIGRRLSPTRTCLVIVIALTVALIGILIGSSFWLYKKSAPTDGQSPPWYPCPRGGTLKSWEDSYKKAAALVQQMTLTEKVNITTGTGWAQDLCVGNTAPAINVGFPPLCLQDGPLGIRYADHSTAFPAGITVGATWNKNLMYSRGRAHGLEARLKGVNVLLGPAMGPMGRMPAGGRNWEGFGSDPVLQGVASAETIRGIQDEGVIATAKHYIANEQEHFRQSFEWGLPNAISSNVDDRTLHELYLWPFAESIKAGVASVMCSYNMINNSYGCGNSKLMNGILKDELGFQGFVQSDWLAQRSGVGSALAGLDLSMPGDGLYWTNGNSLWGPQLTTAVLNSSVPLERINDMATRIVAAWYQLGQDNRTIWPAPPPEGDGGPNFSSWTNDEIGKIHHGSDDETTGVVNKFIDVQGSGDDFHGRLAREVAAEGMVVVKNEGNILPLSRSGWQTGKRLSPSAKLKVGIFGEDAGSDEDPNSCADRGCNQGTLASGWGSGAVEFPYLVTPFQALKSAFDSDSVDVTADPQNELSFRQSPDDRDLCLVFINADGGEGFISSEGIRGDRNDLYPQKGGDDLVRSVATKCGQGKGDTVVIIHSIGPVVVERWIDLPGVKAVVFANLPGEESGNALVDVIFGDVDASGRLPYTVGKSIAEYGEGGQVLYYPNSVVAPQQDFKEGLYIDYRHFDKHSITPRYPFGFGLSYTTFSFCNLTLTTQKPKSATPDPRPTDLKPPTYDSAIPDPSTALFPKGFRKLKKRIYPYITSTNDTKTGRYPYPVGYKDHHDPSPAGGGEGGNPSLFNVHLTVNVTVTNTGARKGKEVVQLYLSFPKDVKDPSTGEVVDFPVKVLRVFEKVELDVGESCTVTMGLRRKDLSYWSVGRQNWIIPTAGVFGVMVGKSAGEIVLEGGW